MRKATFQFRWDWAPALPTVGLWKSVKINSWNDIRLDNINVITDSINDDIAVLSIHANILANYPQKCRITFALDSAKTINKEFQLSKGNNPIHLNYRIDKPTRWQPAGLGKQHLYNAEFKLSANGRSLTRPLTFGIGDIILVQEKDSLGQSFYFRVNGRKVFARGANYVPMDVFLMKSNYKELLLDALHAGFNMLRVWRGGVYEADRFYALCDSLGIMVWQDFMFACALYPGDSNFRVNVEKEVKHQLNRLSAHPCIALWCGNNEVKNAWFDWGWQKKFKWPFADSARIWNNNRVLFDRLIPKRLYEVNFQNINFIILLNQTPFIQNGYIFQFLDSFPKNSYRNTA